MYLSFLLSSPRQAIFIWKRQTKSGTTLSNLASRQRTPVVCFWKLLHNVFVLAGYVPDSIMMFEPKPKMFSALPTIEELVHPKELLFATHIEPDQDINSEWRSKFLGFFDVFENRSVWWTILFNDSCLHLKKRHGRSSETVIFMKVYDKWQI